MWVRQWFKVLLMMSYIVRPYNMFVTIAVEIAFIWVFNEEDGTYVSVVYVARYYSIG